ncbi:MAG: InlB B-repeat-containing protein, partial [Clostridia bacterium]|nr:InlB B-repeat-containing protein [Clostridia bacterium]
MKRSCIKLLSFVFVFIFTLSMVPFDAISDMFGHVLPIASANMAQTENQNKTKKSDDMIPIYSVPKQVTTTYFIVYNANGGTGAPGKQIKSENQDIIIPDQQPIKTGWTFIGWGYSSSSDSVAYKPGATYSENKSRTLYALYRPNFFGDVNGDGVADLTDIEIINKFRRNIIELTNRQQIAADVNLSGEIDIQDMVCINNYRLNYVDRLPADLLAEVSFIPPTKRIYKLNEELDTSGAAVQFTNKDNPEVSYSLNDDLVFSGFDSSSAEKKNMTVLFEVWSDTFEIDVRSPYLLTYNASGGTGAPSSQSFYSGESVILSKKIPTKNGYAFIGWADSANAVIINYFGGNEYYFSGNKTLYAVWTIFGDIDADGKISDSDLLRVSRYAAGLDTSLSEYQKICADVNGDRKITSEDSDIISQYLVQSIKGFPIHERKIQLCVASDVKKQYNIGENLILGEQVFLQYPGNACLPVSGYKVSGYDKTKPGKQTVTVTFGVWSATYEVEVIASSESYTLSFDALGGSGAPEPMTGAVTYTIPATVPTRFGNIFQGWQFLNSSGQYIYYHPGEKITLTKDTILNASWGGSSFSGSGRTLSAYIDDPGETYYEGYTPDASGKYVLYVTDSVDARVWLYDSNGNQLAECKKCNDSRAFRLEYTLTKGEKYFYVFRYNSNTAKGNISYTFGPVYTIAFNATGGKAEPDPQTKDWGWDTEINSDKPSKAFSLSFDANGGFISPSSVTYLCPFNNWNTKPDGSGTAYDPGDEYTDDADVTLYAQWENPIAGELEKPTREGYLFDGWYTAEDGGEEITEDFEVSGDITTYARWVEEPDEFTVSYDANGGEAAPEDQIKTEGRDLTLSEEIPVKVYTISYDSTGGSTEDDSKTVDCIFRYWDSEPDGTGREYDPGDEYTDDADITLYAQWENPVAGELEKPTRVGYLFDGWYTAEDGGEKITEDFEISGDITAYARWVEETGEFTVSFDANGGDEAPEDQIKIEGTDLTLSEKIPEKKYVITYDSTGGRTENEEKTVDCTFIDWNSKPDGSGIAYDPGDEYTDDADVTLYAQWENPIAGELEKPTREGYLFD